MKRPAPTSPVKEEVKKVKISDDIKPKTEEKSSGDIKPKTEEKLSKDIKAKLQKMTREVSIFCLFEKKIQFEPDSTAHNKREGGA